MFGCNNERLFPEKYTVKDHISNNKLLSYSKKTLRKNVPKSVRKYKLNVLMPLGYPIILLKSN